jgi:hypothetical protein
LNWFCKKKNWIEKSQFGSKTETFSSLDNVAHAYILDLYDSINQVKTELIDLVVLIFCCLGEGWNESKCKVMKGLLLMLKQTKLECSSHRYRKAKIDCLRFVVCRLLAPTFQGFFFLLWPFTVLMKQTRQAVRVIKQSIIT